VPLLVPALFGQTATKPHAKKALSKQPGKAVTAADVQALKDGLAAQQQQILQLQQALAQRDQAAEEAQQLAQQTQAAANDAQQKAAALATTAGADKDTVTKLNSDLTDVKSTIQNQLVTVQDEQKRVSALEGAFGRFRWAGDVRVRGESFFQEGVADRNRARIRVRFGFEGKLSEDFVSGVALATGSLGDPTTTNETLTNNFDRKTVGLDRAYITYNPVAHKWLSLTGGKFAYQWQRTQITGDPDLNPEGFNEKLSFDIHQIPVVQNLTVQGMQLIFNEVSGTGGLYHGHDSFAVGGQVSSKLAFKIWTATPSFMILNWRYADAILNSSAFHDSFRRQHWSASCSWRRSRVFESVDYRRRNRFSNCPDQRAESQRVRIFAERYDQLHLGGSQQPDRAQVALSFQLLVRRLRPEQPIQDAIGAFSGQSAAGIRKQSKRLGSPIHDLRPQWLRQRRWHSARHHLYDLPTPGEHQPG